MKRFSKEERSWIAYDWANSAFATIMLAAIFPIFFVGMAGGAGVPCGGERAVAYGVYETAVCGECETGACGEYVFPDRARGSMWWAIGLTITRVVVGFAAPFIGALIDYKGYKKRLFVMALVSGVVFTAFTAMMDSWELMLVAFILAHMFWSICNQIYDSFLPDVTTKDRMDNVSATGFAMGYVGGSTIPFVIGIALIMFGGNFGIDLTLAVRISVVLTAVWWIAFSVPILKNVYHKYETEVPASGLYRQAMRDIANTAKKIGRNKGVLMFLIAYIFYIDGVGTIISIATAYGADLGLDETGMIIALFMTQIVAFGFSLLFGKLSKVTNPMNLIVGSIIVYCVISLLGFVMGFGLEEGLFGTDTAQLMFWALAFMVGTVQGGIQAISRSTYARLIPPEESGEYFGFFEIFGRFASVMGPALYAVIYAVTDRRDFGILAILGLFVIGLAVLTIGRKHIPDLTPEKAGLRDGR